MDTDLRCRLVAGLGNPGRRYEQTRHNVGFIVADELARRAAVAFAHDSKWNADLAPWREEVALMKPRTFMNLSGESVGGYSRFFKLDPAEVVVVIDDVALPLGKLRLRKAGSPGGHNGLDSVLKHLGTSEVPRLRVGIGGGDATALHGHVLGKFSRSEQDDANEAIHRAADAVECICERGFETAMNQFN
ncbi:MAG: aminoacyl-tRNA hydrolase [Chthoniobacterales bacterium]